MTIYDLRCDRCDLALVGPATASTRDGRHGVRFRYHPGTADLGDDAGLLCETCWRHCEAWLGTRTLAACSRCGADLRGAPMLVVTAVGDLAGWLLCAPDACEFLNSLRTVEPKLDPATFRLPTGPPVPAAPVQLRPRPSRPN